MTLYGDRMRAHLARYKAERLGIAESGIWRNNQRAYAHILPEELQALNILETARPAFWEYFEANRASLALHTDFHHLNSSQAFAFNLLFPWTTSEQTWIALLEAFGLTPKHVPEWSFERIVDGYERTCVDFYAVFEDGARLFVEVKLTEPSFGKGKPDDVRRTKLRDVYTPRLAGKVHTGNLDEAAFFLNYQLFRNVSHLSLDAGDTLVILLPRANEFTWAEAEAFIRERLDPACQGRVRMVAVEDIVPDLATRAAGIGGNLPEHMRLLAEKYLPPVTV